MDRLDELHKLCDTLRHGWGHGRWANTLAWAIKEIEKLRKGNHKLNNSIVANAHVIIEHDVVPGSDGSCRCNACRVVAEAMGDAGHLDDIGDQWWLENNE